MKGILLLLFAGLANLLVSVTATDPWEQTSPDDKPFKGCPEHHLHCQQGTVIFVTLACMVFKQQHNRHASTETSDDCSKDFTDEDLSDLIRSCWNKTHCSYKTQSSWTPNGFPEVEHVCLGASSMTDFRSPDPALGHAVAVSYSPKSSDEDSAWECLVESSDCNVHPTSVFMGMLGNADSDGNPHSSICFQENNCIEYEMEPRFGWKKDVRTPFNIQMKLTTQSKMDSAWALVTAFDSTPLKITCGFSPGSSSSKCTDQGPASAKPSTETGETSDPSSGTSPAPPPGQSNPSVTGEDSEQTADCSGSGPLLVGVLVAVAVVEAVVLVAVGVFFLSKRRGRREETPCDAVAWCRRPGQGSPGEVLSAEAASPADSGTASPSAHSTTAAATAPAPAPAASCGYEDVDYNHLGQRLISLSPHDVTYGHLSGGDTVIGNVDDSASPPQRDGMGETEGGVRGASPTGRCLTGNEHDAARPGNGSTSPAERDIETDADYSVITDVTDSPYELAKAIE